MQYLSNKDLPLPKWQKELIDIRLEAIEKDHERLQPIEILMQELDRIED